MFSSFLVLKHDLIKWVDFTRITASNTESDDVTNWVTHRISSTDLSYSCAHFVVKTDENIALVAGSNTI